VIYCISIYPNLSIASFFSSFLFFSFLFYLLLLPFLSSSPSFSIFFFSFLSISFSFKSIPFYFLFHVLLLPFSCSPPSFSMFSSFLFYLLLLPFLSSPPSMSRHLFQQETSITSETHIYFPQTRSIHHIKRTGIITRFTRMRKFSNVHSLSSS
jgi:hypothetical protein